MDDEIKKDNPEISDADVKVLLEYTPITLPKPDVIDDRRLSFTETNVEKHLKKIRSEADKFRSAYPWEDGQEVTPRKKEEDGQKYEKKTYTIQPSAYRRSYDGKSKGLSTYIITAQDNTLDYSNQPKDNSPLGTPSTYKEKYGNYNYTFTSEGRNGIYGKGLGANLGKEWKYAILPGTENIKNIDVRLDKVQGKKIPGEKNAELPPRVLAEAPGAVGKNNKLHVDCIASWNLMREAAKKDGVILKPFSCYRDYNTQLYLWNLYGRNTQRVAPPGHSNHGLGRAMDIGYKGDGLESVTRQRKWMTNNGHKWGWFWGDARTENWHFVYCW